MSTVKHWSDSRWPRSPIKQFHFCNKESFICAGLASLLGTYSDLYFVGKGLYQFPRRLFPEIFTINIFFTLIGLPLGTMAMLYCLSRMNRLARSGTILFVSLLMAMMENIAERLGLFVHSDEWMHLYSFFGYFLFLTIISAVYFALKKNV